MGRNQFKRKPWTESSWKLLKGLLRRNKGKILAGFATMVVTASGWHFKNCVQERNSRLDEFRQALAPHRAAIEKYSQDLSALQAAYLSFLAYLQQQHVDFRVLEQQRSHRVLLLQALDADCNQAKAFNYRLRAVKQTVRRSFLLPPVETQVPEGVCANWSSMLWRTRVLDVKRVAQDSAFRRRLVKEEADYIRDAPRLQRMLDETIPSSLRSDEEALKTLEARHSSLARNLWDCFRQFLLSI